MAGAAPWLPRPLVCSVVVDGLIATSAALIAASGPGRAGHMDFRSSLDQPGTTGLLADLGLTPVIDLNLRLGQGTGAVLAFHIVDAAARILGQMVTFAEADVSEKDAA